ncbi:MAG TPA: phenylalanine--tRNA ligase subunit beta, partial [Spirochaetota bacterium]|nr:phenylalanine--tRNA ligase subunit beta [Spirochaetota bacterium]
MWISLKIIENLVDIKGITPEQIAERLTMSTAEIEGIEYINSHFKTIYTAKLTKVKPHPDADKLTLCEVYTGKETLQVVCGAKNHKEGDIVALATIGTKFS